MLTLGGGVTLTSLGNLLGFGPIDLGLFSVPFTVFAMVGVIFGREPLPVQDAMIAEIQRRLDARSA